MAYRDDSGDLLAAPTAEGPLRLGLAPRAVTLTVATRTLHVVDKLATVVEHRRKRASFKLEQLALARDVPREGLGIWIGLPGGMRRIFGVDPVSLLEPEGLFALAALDKLAARLRTALSEHATDIHRAVEIGRGLDKVLLVDHDDRCEVYARRLFRDRARFAMAVHRDGRIVIHDGRARSEAVVRSRFGITVAGDYLRFAAPDGRDLARISIPWITPEDRDELGRRVGQLVDPNPLAAAIGYPYSR